MNPIKLLILVASLSLACTKQEMRISVSESLKLGNLPSGSGIVKSGDIYYVIGDDSPYLFSLDKDFKIIEKVALWDTSHLVSRRINKAEKPDFETLEMIGEKEIVIFGSGSKSPQRDVFLHLKLGDTLQIEKHNISEFYTELRNLPIFSDSELNIEATAFYDKHIYLFNRKKNLILKFNCNDLLSYLKGKGTFPEPENKVFLLPTINGMEAGFSGATALKNDAKIIFTASVENTDNAYDDGEILGSIIGTIDISNNTISNTFEYCLIPNTDENLKVESVTVEEEISTGKTKLVLVSDDDKGSSVLIKSNLFW